MKFKMYSILDPEVYVNRELATRFFCFDYQDDQSVVPENYIDMYSEYSAVVVIFNNYLSFTYYNNHKQNMPNDFDYQALVWESVRHSVQVVYDHLTEDEQEKLLPKILRYIYITLFSSERGPRLGEFIKIFGMKNFIDKMTNEINNPFHFPVYK